MPESISREDLARQMPLSARILLALCRKNVPPALYAGDSHGPPVSSDPLRQLIAAYPHFETCLINKSVLDFGCAEGEQSRAMIKTGARTVHGIDINAAAIEVAVERGRGIPGLTFSDRIPENAKFDVILSQNSFEHFIDAETTLRQMAAVLAPGGKIFVTFGPPWYSPWGAHVQFFCKVPWVHLLFSESTIATVRRMYRTDSASNYTEMGLAKMSLRKFKRLVSASGFSIEYFRLDSVKGLRFLLFTPLRELFVSQINCILSRAP